MPVGLVSRRAFLGSAGMLPGIMLGLETCSSERIRRLRRQILDSPMRVALHRAQVFTRVFQQQEDKPWVLRKALALREYFRTVPLYLRPGDRLAGSISESPGSLPVMVELGIAELRLVEKPHLQGYLKGQVPPQIREYWANRNLWGRYRIEILGEPPVKSADELPEIAPNYKLISNQGHLSPSYGEVLRVGLGGLLEKVRSRKSGERDPDKAAFLEAAEHSLRGLSEWIQRYAEFLSGLAASGGEPDLKEMARIAAKVALQPPGTFREALQLVWFIHQAIHIEGHGWSCAPDHLDQLLLPYYEADKKAGRLDDAQALELCENFVLKMLDNTYWGKEQLTQGLCAGGSTPAGDDLTNRLSRLFIEAATNLSLPEPLIWIRWHPNIDQEFFDFCLSRLARSTCFPMMWNDRAVAAGFMELGVAREDAYNYIPVGCNELALPGQAYFNPGAHANYLRAIELALTSGKGYKGDVKGPALAPPTSALRTFEDFAAAFGAYLRDSIRSSYAAEMKLLRAQMNWGHTPLTSCFFDGCVEEAHDMVLGTKYNILSCGGAFFANAVDCLAAIREVVYEKREATLEEIAAACRANFRGYERLRAKLLAAPKHGNDDPRLDDIIHLVERLRTQATEELCRDPRGGTKFGHVHITKDAAVRQGLRTPATPDGRLAGTPLASSVAAAAGCERSGPTALLNSVAKLNAPKSWQSGYQANIRFQANMLSEKRNRDKVRALLNVYFAKGGQQLQINAVDTETLRAAQKNPEKYSDLVVRVAGFSAFFVTLSPEVQEEIISRVAHM